MPQSLVQIQARIERLKREAEVLRDKEVAGVVERIRAAIAHYGLAAEDLFDGGAKRVRKSVTHITRAPKPRAQGRKVRVSSLAGKKLPVKFKDDQGNTWTGRGNKPRWLTAAIASGKTIEQFAVA